MLAEPPTEKRNAVGKISIELYRIERSGLGLNLGQAFF